MMRPLPLPLTALPAPLDVILLVSGRVRYVGGQAVWNSRLEEAVAAFELLVLVLDDFDAIDNLHKACLKLLGLSDTIG
jgi:hypothetical protein